MNRTGSQLFQLLITYVCCRQPENVPAENRAGEGLRCVLCCV